MDCSNKIKYLSFGSPLMDIIGDVNDDFIHDYKIKLDNTVHTSLKDIAFFNDLVSQHQIEYIPGGCQFNAMRVFNWMNNFQDQVQVAFLGSVGSDKYGELYAQLLERENILPVFESIDEINTGMCIVVCNKQERSHFTDLGASTKISTEFVERMWNKFQNVELIYTELFILQHQRATTFKLAKFGLSNKRKYGFNLPATFFIEKYFKDIKVLVAHADIVFCNIAEAKYFYTKLGYCESDTIEKIVRKLASLEKENKKKNRVFVITAGANPAWVCEYNFQEEREEYCNGFEAKHLDNSLIVDTNGAGDSFAGGFLSQYMKGKPLSDCMKAGHWISWSIIQKRGFQLPDYKFSDN